MPKPSLSTLQTPANGQVFSLAKQLSISAVSRAFDAADAKADGRAVVKVSREKRLLEGADYFASLISFPLSGPPAFFPNSDLEEETFGFLLLVEVEVAGNWYLGVFKHRVATIAEWLDKNCTPLPRTKLTHAFSDGTAVGKMTVRRMTASKHELRRASYEASDLQTSLPMMAAGRNAISAARFDGADGSFAVTPGTSRVQRSGGRCTVDQLAKLVAQVATATTANKTHPFLATFAQAVPLDELPTDVAPNSILFDWTELLETDELELCRASPAVGQNGPPIRKSVVLRLLGETVPVVADGARWRFTHDPANSLGRFGETATKYSVKEVLGDLVFIRDTRLPGSAPVRLAKWVRDNDTYAITFTSPQYFFCGGALYFRAAFAKEVDLVRTCLHAEAALTGASSEKGEPKKSHTVFPFDSIFGIVEHTLYPQRDWLCCADLGDEWADYICIRDGKLLFIHCKNGDLSKGASCFHDVVGQGLKNLGHVRSTPEAFASKIANSWDRNYWGHTKIRRIRDTGKKGPDFAHALKNLLADPDSAREVHLVVTMLSLAAFEAIDRDHPPAYFLQVIWLLSSFINSCRESGAKPIILCQP